uniref:C-type lectin 4 n=1 Tax=Crotalus horridus TaxID=35024 RepID=T1DJZ7_CROHD
MGRFIFVSFGLLVVAVSLTGTGAGFCCPLGWSSYEGHCYRVFQQKMTWDDAEKFCTQQHKGSHLVSFQSSEEVDFVMTGPMLELDLVWIGLSNIWNECTLEWTNGNKVDYKAWSAEPECIVSKTTDKHWFSRPCSKAHKVVCKFQA